MWAHHVQFIRFGQNLVHLQWLKWQTFRIRSFYSLIIMLFSEGFSLLIVASLYHEPWNNYVAAISYHMVLIESMSAHVSQEQLFDIWSSYLLSISIDYFKTTTSHSAWREALFEIRLLHAIYDISTMINYSAMLWHKNCTKRFQN